MPEKSLKKNAALNVIKTIMSLIFPLITFPYASRILLPEAIGKVNFANSIVSYFAIFASLGISTYAIRGAAQLKNDKEQFSKFVKEIFTINLISTIVAYVLLACALIFVPKFCEYRILIIISASTILLTTFGINWIYSALEDYAYITIRSIVFQIISMIFLFTFVKTKDDYVFYMLYGVLSSVGSNICNFIHARKFVNFKIKVKLELKKHLKSIFILFGSSVAISVFTILDTSMLGFLTDDIQVGYYSAASKISRMIRDLFPAVTTVLFARFSIYNAQKEEEKVLGLISKTMNFIFCFSLPIACGIFILAEPLVLLLCGSEFLAAIPSLKFMSFLIILSAVSSFLGGQVLLSEKKDKEYLFVTVLGSLIAFISNLIFIPFFKASGASFATLFTEFIIFLCYIYLLRTVLLQSKIILPLIQYIVSSVMMSVAVYYIKDLFTNTILQLFVSTFTGIIIYALMLLVLRNKFFIETSKLIIKKMRRK